MTRPPLPFSSGGDTPASHPDMMAAFGEHTFSSMYMSPQSLMDQIGPHLDPSVPETHLFSEVKAFPLPTALNLKRSQVNSRSYMGLFPELRHAWITVDGDLYLWDYVKNSYKLAKQYPSVITSVTLTFPPKNLFIDSVKYLLVTATAVSIHVDCVRVTPTSSNAAPTVGLSREDMIVSVDSTSVSALASTVDGRIFYGGFTGSIYELAFVPVTSLWNRIPFLGSQNNTTPQKLQKINHTSGPILRVLPESVQRLVPGHPGPIKTMTVHDSLNILAILHESIQSPNHISGGYIQFVQLRDPLMSNQPTFRLLLKLPSLLQLAYQGATVNTRDSWLGPSVSIISLHAVDSSESKTADFVAVTSTATRIYFSLSQDYNIGTKINVLHVRMPPSGNSISLTVGLPAQKVGSFSQQVDLGPLRSNLIDNFIPRMAYASYYARGVFLASLSLDQSYDLVIGTAIDLPRDYKLLIQSPRSNTYVQERAHLVKLPGRTHAICEIDPATGGVLDIQARSQFPVDEQDMPRHFLFLTSDGLRIIVKRRPIDELAYLVRVGVTSFPENFVPAYGRSQVCAWLIALACGDLGYLSTDLLPSPALASDGISISSSSQMRLNASDPIKSFMTSPLSGNVRTSLIQRLFHEAGGLPQPASAVSGSSNQHTDLGHTVKRSQVEYSGCADGLALYLNHVLKPMWGLPILIKNPSSVLYEMSVTETTLIRIQDKLSQLTNFIDAWPQRRNNDSAYSGISALYTSSAQLRPGDEFCWALEREYLTVLFEDVRLALEAVRFVRLLAGYKLPSVAHKLPPTQEGQALLDNLLHLPLCDLVKSSSGRETLGQVATQIVQLDTALEDCGFSSTTFAGNTLAHLLHEWCSSLLSIEDVFAASILEFIKQYRDLQGGRVPDEVWARNVIQPRDELLNNALHKALEVADQFKQHHLIDICHQLTDVGFIIGTVDLCLRRANLCDPQGLAIEYYRDLHRVYNEQRELVLQKRQVCYELAIGALERLRERFVFTQQQALPELESIFSMAQQQVCCHVEKSNDELWHYELYRWYMKLGFDSSLASLSTPYIEQWLRLQHSVHGQLLLAKHFESQNRYADAARTMLEVAIAPAYIDSNTPDSYTLNERKTMLLNALQTAKATTDAVLIQEIADHVDVAQLQELLANELELSSKSKGDDSSLTEIIRQLRFGSLLSLQDLHPLACENKLTILQFQMYTIAGTELNIEYHEMVELWHEAMREPVNQSVGAAVAALTQLFVMGGSVKGRMSGLNAIDSSECIGMVMQAGSAMGSPLYNAKLWVPILMDMTESSPELCSQPDWWVDVASRAEVVDIVGVAHAVVDRVHRAPVGNRESALNVLVEVMMAWVYTNPVFGGAWGLLVSDFRQLLRNAPEHLVSRFRAVEELFEKQVDQQASFSTSMYSSI